MLKLVYVGGLGMMAGPAAIHLTPAESAQVLRVHDRGNPGKQRDRFREVWREHGAELVPTFEQLIGDGAIDGVVICAGKNGDDLPLVTQLSGLLAQRCMKKSFILHLSTVSASFVEAAVLFCAEQGVDYVNYPLTGGPLGAMLGGGEPKGMLILASGEEKIYKRLLPTLEKLGHPRHFGSSPTAGAITKLIGQHLVFNGLVGISTATALHTNQLNEGVLGGELQGEYLGFLNGGAGGTRQWDVSMKRGVEEDAWNVGFYIRHAVVDAIYAAQLAIDAGLPRFAIQSVINVAFAFSYVLERYPDQTLATHAVVREMTQSNAASLDRFMESKGAYAGTAKESLAACIETLPERVKETVVAELSLEYFQDGAGSQ
ncbi:MAG: NAD(P)-dependent oxidoreductase [Gammaproteobacteria bacterium]|nr:NAD(P)-dependent oxidoreductase [Gammaproteobacteria bacterium]